MANLSLVFLLTFVFGLAFLGGFAARSLKQSPILGYILAGLVIGQLLNRFFPGQTNTLLVLGEIGLILLLFTLGLELPFKRLSQVREVVIWGGVIQILLVAILGILLLPLVGFDFYSSLFIGVAFSLSSTAVVLKILAERGELDTLPGEVMLGWLLIQDLAVLPMMVVLPSLGRLESGGWLTVGLAILKAAVLLLVALSLGRRLVPLLLDKVARLKSPELLLLSAFSLCLVFAALSQSMGVSLAFGAFLAGVIISSSTEKLAVFSQMKPLRDFFSTIFFVSLGIFLNPSFLLKDFFTIIGLSAFVVLIKFLIVFALVLYLGYHLKTATLVGMGLIQVGEFSFILAQVGLGSGLIDKRIYSLIASVALMTIFVTPWIIKNSPKVYFCLQKLLKRKISRDHFLNQKEEISLENHIVICGYGRVGGWLGRALQLLEIPFLVIDYDYQIAALLKEKGIRVLLGDPTDAAVLRYAKVDKAKVVVITLPDRLSQEMVVQNCLTINPKIKLISRVHHQDDQAFLKALGVQKVIQPEFEASLSIIHRVLQFLDVSNERITSKIKRIKIEHGMN